MTETPTASARRDLPRTAFLIAVAAIVVLQLALILRHQYFVDEWQALLIAVESPDLATLLGHLRYEGHPPLWYLFLRGLSALVGPERVLMAASLLCSMATIALVSVSAPVPRWARLAILLAEPMLFEYGTISRGSSLGVALIFAALVLWRQTRAVWAVLALLPLVDFLFGVIAVALIGLRRGEGRPLWWPGLAAFGTCGAVAAWSVIPAADFVSVYRDSPPLDSLARWLSAIAAVGLPVQWSDGPRWDAPWSTPLTPVIGIAFLAMVYHQTRGRPFERAAALGVPLVMLGFMLAVHMLALRHVMLAGVAVIAVLWRQGEAGVPIRRPTAIWLAASALCGLATAAIALARPFDTAPTAAQAIRDLGLEKETWLSFPSQHAQGVSVLAGIPFESAERECRQTVIRWNFRHRLTDPGLLREWLAREARQGGTFYLLSQYSPAAGGTARLVASVPAGLDGKAYYLYRVPGARPGRRAAAPPCIAGARKLPQSPRGPPGTTPPPTGSSLNTS